MQVQGMSRTMSLNKHFDGIGGDIMKTIHKLIGLIRKA